MEEGRYDAIILAAAGLVRLGWDGKIRQYLPTEFSIPAIGQGALGIEVRLSDAGTREAVEFLNDRDTSLAVRAERGFLKRLEGGCQVPIAAYARTEGDTIRITGLVGRPDGTEILRSSRSGKVDDPERIGVALAEELLSRGGKKILEEVYRQNGR
jgi:hydroxymethylbilane synthase